MYSINLEALPKHISGVISHDEGSIKLNSSKSQTRQTISLIHELIHLYFYISKKKPMIERDVHDLSVFIYSEVLPRVNDLKRIHNSLSSDPKQASTLTLSKNNPSVRYDTIIDY